MSQEGTAVEVMSSEDELSDYLELLACMRKRLEARGIYRAVELVEQLDDAILRAIADERPRPILRIVK